MRLNRRTAVSSLAIASTATLVISFAAPAAAKPAHRPAAPTGLAVTSNATGLSLSWHHHNAVTGYLVQQAANSAFTAGLHSYRTRGIQPVFTPSHVSTRGTYFYRVAAMNGKAKSRFSNVASATDVTRLSKIRVLTYNSLSASLSGTGQHHTGGAVAPFSKRRAGQLALLNHSDADILGIEEAASCLQLIRGKPCYRQIDSLAAGLPAYTLDDTTASSAGVDRYAADDILYKASAVTPVGAGGHFLIGPSGAKERFAAYQIFSVKATGATLLYVATHTLATGGRAGDKIRGQEVTSMLRQARSYAAGHGVSNVIYVGDFNSYAGEFHVHDYSGSVMRNAGVPDSVGEAAHYSNAKYDSINAYFRKPKQGHGSSDHIYATRGIAVLRWGELLHLRHGKFVGTIPSDHNPVYADVELPY